MTQQTNYISQDRTLEVSENVILLWGNIVCNSPLVTNDDLLNTRCHQILQQAEQIHSELKWKMKQ